LLSPQPPAPIEPLTAPIPQSYALYARRPDEAALTYRATYVMHAAAIREGERLAYEMLFPHVRVIARWADGARAIAWDNRDLDAMAADPGWGVRP
jgi:hypothetical protein